MEELSEKKENYRTQGNTPDFMMFSDWNSMTQTQRLLDDVIRLRKEMGITQSMLAEQAGVGTQTISSLETKLKNVTFRNFCAIISALDYELIIVPISDK